ncbi:nucleoside deaminase [Orrella sp. 11846]|uniref:nucleoside deaminase n=1 Tax=Orrella sp. 11846 TaxID=3409913 RepID=UPI003B591BF1
MSHSHSKSDCPCPHENGKEAASSEIGQSIDLGAQRLGFMQEACRLATESVERGLGGPFGAVIVKDGQIIGRGQNRVLLTGIPVFHAEIMAIIDACQRINPKPELNPNQLSGTTLELIARQAGDEDTAPARARMLKGCELYSSAAPCPMCLSAIYWARIDRVYFAANVEDAREIGFDDAFQYEDFAHAPELRRLEMIAGFGYEMGLAAFEAWRQKKNRHPY